EDPRSPHAWRALAETEQRRGRRAAARTAWTALASLEPADPEPRIRIGLLWELDRQYDTAEDSYRMAIQRAPRSARAHRVLGARLLRWDRPAEAIPSLERSLALDPKHAETWNALAIAQLRAGKNRDALGTFRRAIDRHPRFLALRLGLAKVLIDEGDHRGALGVYDEIARNWPNFAAVHVGRGLLLHELGDQRGALAAFAQAAEDASDPNQRKRFERQLEDYRRLIGPKNAPGGDGSSP
ncbi:MAG: tetratricopeptide repeat protein, partial [Myxococcales bacterium]|nr:tetratricopeptide repeat protein [Myxococcales bacterium]